MSKPDYYIIELQIYKRLPLFLYQDWFMGRISRGGLTSQAFARFFLNADTLGDSTTLSDKSFHVLIERKQNEFAFGLTVFSERAEKHAFNSLSSWVKRISVWYPCRVRGCVYRYRPFLSLVVYTVPLVDADAENSACRRRFLQSSTIFVTLLCTFSIKLTCLLR